MRRLDPTAAVKRAHPLGHELPTMNVFDFIVLGLYMLLMIGVGLWVSKRASKNAESYFLADKTLPWWIIGIAHGSSGLDVTGTMWFVMMFFVYGLKAVWLVWVWPLFNVIFRMMYLGTWVRRSNVLTGAEWMRTRFGESRGAGLAYLSVIVYALVSVVGFLTYAFQGIGKFAAPFFPWEFHPNVYATVIMLVAGVYCVMGGMYSVILNDLIQLVLKVFAAVLIAVLAIQATSSADLMANVPENWDNIFFGWNLDLDWGNHIPQLNDKLQNSITEGGDGYYVFGFFIAMLFLKGVIVSMAGPTPNYAIQHILSTRSPREAALENLVMALVSIGPRFLLIAGIAVLGIVYFQPTLRDMGAKPDFEMILPQVVNHHLPPGCRGLLVAALIAAFMSMFVATANSGVAYIVNDIYRRYINPQAPAKKMVLMGYIWTMIVILAGIGFGFVSGSVHAITEWLVSGLVPAFVAPNVLKWHWWRFNGWGFFAGMVAGTAAAVLKIFLPGVHPVWTFMLILGISGAASVITCLLTLPEEDELLMRFYTTVRPWGFWGPIDRLCKQADPEFKENRDFRIDCFNIAVGVVWQVALVALPMYLVIQQWGRMSIALGIFLGTSLILKFTWYDRLGPGEMYMVDPEKEPALPE